MAAASWCWAPSTLSQGKTVKCGGKSAAWVKPGVNAKFINDVRMSARHNMAARHTKYGQRWGELCVFLQKHNSMAWVTRAKEDLEPYLAAAMEGTLPNMVKCSCECKNTHHVMCSKTGKRRQADAEIINPVLMWLRKLANQVREVRLRASNARRPPQLASPPPPLLLPWH